MMLGALVSWWYTAGWMGVFHRGLGKVGSVMGFFSVGTLFSTLFEPFHQISAGQVQGPFEARMRAFGDRLFSRIFGAVIRGLFIVAGLIAGAFGLLLVAVVVVLWPFVPLLPFIGLALTAMGWVPTW